ncbi:hypothetical protein FKM82_004834 [Ascaphus truei]
MVTNSALFAHVSIDVLISAQCCVCSFFSFIFFPLPPALFVVVSVGNGVEVSPTQYAIGSLAADVAESVPPQTTQSSSSPHPESVPSSQAENTESKDEEAKEIPAAGSDSAHNSSEEQELSPDKAKLKKKNRCFMCRKKIGLSGFECRCGNVFCGTHRYSDIHSCSYDYKADAAEKIRKENPVVVGEKVQKI